MSRSLGQQAYERYSALLGIGEQIGKGGKIQVGPEPWHRLNGRERHLWETFAGDFARDVIQIHQEATRRTEAERESKAVRSDLYEQEVRRRVAEALAESRKP